MIRSIAILVLAACCAGAAVDRPGPDAPPGTMSPFLQLVERIDRDEPIDRHYVEKLAGKDLQCRQSGLRTDCNASDLELAGARVGRLDFRQVAAASLLILEPPADTCAAVSRLMAQFAPLALENSCTDGATCMYASTKRAWGRLSVGLKQDPSSQCARSIVFNSINKQP